MSDFRFLSLNLKRFRGDAHLSQAQLAAAAGVRQQYVSALECGLRPSSMEHVRLLAGVLGVEPDALLSRRRVVGSRAA